MQFGWIVEYKYNVSINLLNIIFTQSIKINKKKKLKKDKKIKKKKRRRRRRRRRVLTYFVLYFWDIGMN